MITPMRYLPPSQDEAFIESMSFARLRELNDGVSQRADFHVLAFIDEGRGSVMIDFVAREIEDRSVAWIPAGAVHRWTDIGRVSGTLVLFVPSAPATRGVRSLTSSSTSGAVQRLSATGWRLVGSAREHLRTELELPRSERLATMPPILLAALLTRAVPTAGGGSGRHPLFSAFRDMVDADFCAHHDVGYYAKQLGYSPRTLMRAVKSATGGTAKAYIVQRLALEAKRLLAHERLTAAECAAALGFSDPSNFATFFRALEGRPPAAWQKDMALDD